MTILDFRKLAPFAVLVQAATTGFEPAALGADERPVLFHEDFEGGDEIATRWVERGFSSISRVNAISVETEANGNHYLRVESARSSSGRGIYMKVSPQLCPHLSWRWKISNTISAADIRRKDGDDAAAKLYLIFSSPSWWNPLDKRILVYVWDNKAPVGSIHPNTWLPDQERMVVLESGEQKAGKWVREEVQIDRDFIRAFDGEVPRELEALAFLADTDNTSSYVVASLDDVVIRCKPGRSENQ